MLVFMWLRFTITPSFPNAITNNILKIIFNCLINNDVIFTSAQVKSVKLRAQNTFHNLLCFLQALTCSANICSLPTLTLCSYAFSLFAVLIICILIRFYELSLGFNFYSHSCYWQRKALPTSWHPQIYYAISLNFLR